MVLKPLIIGVIKSCFFTKRYSKTAAICTPAKTAKTLKKLTWTFSRQRTGVFADQMIQKAGIGKRIFIGGK